MRFNFGHSIPLKSRDSTQLFDCSIPSHPPRGLDFKDLNAMEEMFFILTERKLLGEDWLQCYITEMLAAKFDGQQLLIFYTS